MSTQGQFLNKYYQSFQKNKPSLSQRAFAQYLGFPAPRLHDFMNDKRVLTLKAAEQISNRLALSPEEKEQFIKVVQHQRGRGKKHVPVLKLSIADFRRISDWYYFAILALADTVDFNSHPSWVAKRLAISEEVATHALGVLHELGFLHQENGKLVLTNTDVETETDIPSEDLRKSHKQSLRRVIDELDQIDVSDREVQSITFAGDPKKLKMAKALIRNFSQKVVAQLESGRRSEVYELNVQLMPVSKRVANYVPHRGDS